MPMVGGINTNRLSLDTVGHNITNASTTGYSRQSVNQAATNAQEVYSIYGTQLVGTGVDSLSITRARNIYADKQYWKENGDNSYYTAQQTNYSKLEAIFNDSDDTGVENAMPFVFFPDYEFSLDDAIVEKMAVQEPEDILVYSLLTIPNGEIKEMTANLLAPVVINRKTM